MTYLQAFLSGTGTKQADLAVRLGVSRGYFSQLVGGTKQPSLDLAFAIERETGGAVPASSWVAEPEDQKGAA